jgi:disulfide bond formation protein DsbB
MLYVAWVQAIVATLGSLYFSEMAHLTPCTLCWYQRICMYPLVAILGVGIREKNKNISKYVWPLSLTGWAIALYQNLLMFEIISRPVYSCLPGVDCSVKSIIPPLSLIAFTVINICVWIYSKKPEV